MTFQDFTKAVDFNPLPHTRENRLQSSVYIRIYDISIHSLIRGRTASQHIYTAVKWISIHSLIRGRTCLSCSRREENKFQSTPSYEGEQSLPIKSVLRVTFQSTPSYEGEPTAQTLTTVQQIYFNPLPHTRENGFCRTTVE